MSEEKGKEKDSEKMEKSGEEEERRKADFGSSKDIHVDDDSGDDEEEEEEEELSNDKQPPDDQARAKREKRLAMNRASARERRRRKRILLEKLEERVLELTKRNTSLQELNEEMQGRVQQLEVDLARANSLITTLSAGGAGGSTAARAAGLEAATSNPILSALLGQELDNERLRSLLTLQTVAGGASGARSILQGGGASSTDALLTEVLAERQILQGLLTQQHQRRSLLGGPLGGTDSGLTRRSSLLGATSISGPSYLGARRGGNTLASPEIRTPRLSIEETKMEGFLPGSTLTPPRSSSTFGDDAPKKKSVVGKKVKSRRMEGDARARKRVRGN